MTKQILTLHLLKYEWNANMKGFFFNAENTLLLTANTLGITVNSDQYSVEIPQIPLKKRGEEQKTEINNVCAYLYSPVVSGVSQIWFTSFFKNVCYLKRAQRLLLSQYYPIWDHLVTSGFGNFHQITTFLVWKGDQNQLHLMIYLPCGVFWQCFADWIAYKSCGNEICLQVAAWGACRGAC